MSLYDPGLEIAFLVRHAGRAWTGGRAVHDLVSNVDVVATILEAVGLQAPGDVQGRSLRPLLDGDRPGPRDAVFAQTTWHCYYDPRRCIRTADHKLTVNFSVGYAVMIEPIWRHRSTAKLPWWPSRGTVELYDLHADPLEFENLGGDPAYKGIRTELLARLYQRMVDVRDPVLDGPVALATHRAAVNELRGAAR